MTPEEKQPYQTLAEQDRKRFSREFLSQETEAIEPEPGQPTVLAGSKRLSSSSSTVFAPCAKRTRRATALSQETSS